MQAEIPNQCPDRVLPASQVSFKDHYFFCFLLSLLFIYFFVLELLVNSFVLPLFLRDMKFYTVVTIFLIKKCWTKEASPIFFVSVEDDNIYILLQSMVVVIIS